MGIVPRSSAALGGRACRGSFVPFAGLTWLVSSAGFKACATEELIQRLCGGRAGRSWSGAGVLEENSAGGRGRAEVGRRGLKCDIAARRADRCRSARAIGLRSVGRDGNALRGGRAARRGARARIADR